jgi:hypothetical protein
MLKFFQGTARRNSQYWASGWDHLTKWASFHETFSGVFLYDPKHGKDAEKFLSYFPGAEPWALLILYCFLMFLALFCLSSVFLWPTPGSHLCRPEYDSHFGGTESARASSGRPSPLS